MSGSTKLKTGYKKIWLLMIVLDGAFYNTYEGGRLGKVPQNYKIHKSIKPYIFRSASPFSREQNNTVLAVPNIEF